MDLDSDDIMEVPIRKTEVNNKYELEGGNNTMGFVPIRRPFSQKIDDDNMNMPGYKRINSDNQNKFANVNLMISNSNLNEIANENKFHDLSYSLNYGFLSNSNQMKKPLSFEEALKQQQGQNNSNPNNGRITIVKKLPPIDNNDSKSINTSNNNPGFFISQNLYDAANINKNYNPQSQASNVKQYNNIISPQQQENNNEEKDDGENAEENNQQINENNEEGNEEINNENKNEDNENENANGNKIDISYNDFDDSGWVKNYGGVSRPGMDANGNQKINQDTLVSLTNINSVKDFNIFGVLDGHGLEGHFVSHFASDYIPSQIINDPEIKSLSDPEQIYEKLKENECQIIMKAFLSCDEELKNVDFDAYNSGTTCNLVIHIGKHIICANTGDSRAIVTYDEQQEDQELKLLEAAQLSIDYKPEIPEEKNRILLSGGIVQKTKNEYGQEFGPYRVWAQGENYPGLAMSRSIGDLKGKTVGIVANPGIMEYDLEESTKYIIIGSDGVWEFLNNDIVKDIGKKYYLENDASDFCHQIINNSVVQWQNNEIVIDDITVVAVFF
jgi:serine/threonine protein phosphatase PrpC